jgi:hypothetical protein
MHSQAEERFAVTTVAARLSEYSSKINSRKVIQEYHSMAASKGNRFTLELSASA